MFSLVYKHMAKHPPSYYETQLKTLNGDFSVTLNEMTAAFPYAKAYPNVNAMTERYSEDKGAMDKVRADLFLFRDNLEQDIEITAKTIARIIGQIAKVEKDNAKMMVRLQGLENKREGAIGMYDDTRTAYNFKLLENWLIFLGSVGLAYGIYKA
jgi:hypothetical protein